MDFLGLQARRRQRQLRDALQQAPAIVSQARLTVTGPTQPHEPEHPGSDSYPYAQFTTASYWLWHIKGLAIYPTAVTYLLPKGVMPIGGFPVIAVSPGKFLDNTDYYAAILQHICRKGYVVLFVDADSGPVDCEHNRMAGEFLQAVYQTLVKKIGGRTASPPQLAWWGHSMGAKVQGLAARMTVNRYYLRPTAIIANNFSNSKGAGGFCNDDLVQNAPGIPADIWYTLIRGDRDDIAKDDPRLLYDRLGHLAHRQLITAVSYPADDLIADHYTPLTGQTLLRMGSLNALDWWLYWKIAVGAFDYHFKGGPDKWAYGTERENGGTDSAGQFIKHKVEP